MLEETFLGGLCKEVVHEVPPCSVELIDFVPPNSLCLILAFICSPSPSFKQDLFIRVNSFVFDSNVDMALVYKLLDILKGNVINIDKSLGTFGAYNSSLDP